MRELVERFQSDVFGLCLRLLRQRQDAEDVAQEVFIRVFRSIGRRDDSRPFKPWLLGITVNRCRTWMAKIGRRPATVDYLSEMPDDAPPVGDSELATGIANAVNELRDDYREVFILFHETGRSYEEIAEVVDRPVGTVKTWIHRARAQVLAFLQERGLVPNS
jgi:RNA polymerase sigma-70 factor (ECF subfamily)